MRGDHCHPVLLRDKENVPSVFSLRFCLPRSGSLFLQNAYSLSTDSLDLLPSKGHSVNYSIALNISQVLTQKQFSDVFRIWRGV